MPQGEQGPNRLKGEEILKPDSWRGDWYKMGFGEVWIDTGQIDVHIEVADGTVHVNLYPNKPDRQSLAEAGVIRFNGVWEDDDSWMDFGEERNDDG